MRGKPAILAPWLTAVLMVMLAVFPQQAGASNLSGIAGPSQSDARTPTNLQPNTAIPGSGYVYTVQPGNDLWIIAVSHGLDMDDLAAENRIDPPYLIHPGDKLWVAADPAPVPQQNQPAPEAAPAEEVPAVEASPEVPTPSEPAQDPSPASSPAEETSASDNEAPDQSTDAETDDWDMAIIGMMNQRRAEFGLAPLSWSAELDRAAQAHAEDLARRGWGSHVGSDGAVLQTRLIRAGYPVGWAGENWANARNLQHAFDMWWYEPPGADPHRQNILGSTYAEIGIGIAKGGWGYYFVADFGSR